MVLDNFLGAMVLGSFQCRGVLLRLHIVGQGPAVLAAGTGRVGYIFSSPEPLGSQGELIVYPYSGVRCRRCRRRQQCLNISSETALPIKAKFYVEPPWEGGTKVCINGPGHMTKMAAFKNLLLQNQKSYDLVTWHVALGTQALQSLYK